MYQPGNVLSYTRNFEFLQKLEASKMAVNNSVAGKLLEAANFACIKHENQRRNNPAQTPYINHPIGVAYILWKEGDVFDIAVLQVKFCQRLKWHTFWHFGAQIDQSEGFDLTQSKA